MPAAARTFLIQDQRQLEALASPVRQEVVDAVEAAGPCSVAEIAVMVGRPPDSLYYHVRMLEQVGLLEPAGTRDTERRVEALYDLPGRPLRLKYEPGDPGNLRVIRRTAAAMFRLTERDFGTALESGGAVVAGPRRDTWAGRFTGWLTPGDLVEINRHLRGIHRIFRHNLEADQGRLHAIAFGLAPLGHRAPRQGA